MSFIDEVVNKIHHGSWVDILPYLPKGCVQLVFTSPPYEDMKNYRDKEGDVGVKNLNGEEFIDFYWIQLFDLLKGCVANDGIVCINVNDKRVDKEIRMTNYDGMRAVTKRGWFLVEHVAWLKTRGIGKDPEHALQDWWEHIYVFGKGKPYKYYPGRIRGKYSDSTTQRYGLPEDPKLTVVRKIGSGTARVHSDGRELEEDDNMSSLKLSEDGKLLPNVLQVSPDGRRYLKHAARFPLDLPRWGITLCTDKNDIVLDPMCGSGTTPCVARFMERRFIGIDIIKDNVEMSRHELEKYYPQIELFDEQKEDQMEIEV